MHVARVARRFQILKRKPTEWRAPTDPDDPAKYDFALFGLGVPTILY